MLQLTIRLATESDLNSLIHLKAEVDFALKGQIWSDLSFQENQNYFAKLWACGQIIIAMPASSSRQETNLQTTLTKQSTVLSTLREQSVVQATTAQIQQSFCSAWHFALPPNLPTFIEQAQPLILGAAFIQYIPAHNEGHLYLSKLYVRPTFRRQGIATQILDYASALTLDFNCHALSLDTNPSLSAALQLYLKHGFIIAPPPEQLHLAEHELYLVRRHCINKANIS